MWVDLVSAECYLAKRRLEEAVSGFEHPSEVQVRYRAFELGAPAPAVTDELVREAAGEGLRIGAAGRDPSSTFDAHRMVQMARAQGGPALQGAVLERLFSAHFAEGRKLDDHEALQRLGAEAGLDERRLAAILAEAQYTREVRADEQEAAQLGIEQVPTVRVNLDDGVAGLRTTEDYLTLLQDAWRNLGR